MKEIIKVVGMMCEHCEAKVTKALLELDGVSNVEADHKEGTCTVEFDETKVSLKELKKTIKKVGFKAK